MDITSLLIQLISGVVGGNVAGAANKAKNLGPLLNTILGALGGLGGGQLAGAAMGGGTATEVGAPAPITSAALDDRITSISCGLASSKVSTFGIAAFL